MKPKVLLYTLPPSGGDFFPISLGYIAASLKKHNIETVIAEIDQITKHTPKEITDFINSYQPLFVGFSVYQANIKLALELARIVKMTKPETIVVFGGPQTSFMPKEALRQMREVDIIVRGEGENIWPELVHCVITNSDPKKVKGIVFMRDNKVIETLQAPLVDNLDHLPSPYLENIFDFRQHEAAIMLTSRGCCYNCAFCYTPRAFRRIIRTHSPKRVLRDISICVKSGIKRFLFADPSFTFDKKRVAAIMRSIIKKRLDIEIWCETRTDLIDHPLLSLMAKAGVKYIAYGLESADANVNKLLRKPIDLNQFEKIVKLTQEVGIIPEVFTLYGLPGQTRASCLKTLDFLKRLGINILGNSAGQQLHLFFGTDITDNPKCYGIRILKKRRPLYLSQGTDFVTKYMKRCDIIRVAKAYKNLHPQNTKQGNCISLL